MLSRINVAATFGQLANKTLPRAAVAMGSGRHRQQQQLMESPKVATTISILSRPTSKVTTTEH